MSSPTSHGLSLPKSFARDREKLETWHRSRSRRFPLSRPRSSEELSLICRDIRRQALIGAQYLRLGDKRSFLLIVDRSGPAEVANPQMTGVNGIPAAQSPDLLEVLSSLNTRTGARAVTTNDIEPTPATNAHQWTTRKQFRQ